MNDDRWIREEGFAISTLISTYKLTFFFFRLGLLGMVPSTASRYQEGLTKQQTKTRRSAIILATGRPIIH